VVTNKEHNDATSNNTTEAVTGVW